MSVVIKTLGTTATLSDEGWTSDDTEVERILNEKTELIEITTANPNPPLAIAQAIVADFGGEVLRYNKAIADPESDQ